LAAGRGQGKPAAPKLGVGRPHPGCNSGIENTKKQGWKMKFCKFFFW